MKYNIQPTFKMSGLQGDLFPFVFTPVGMTRIRDNAMISILSELTKHAPTIEIDILDSLFVAKGIDPLAGRAFLEQLHIIKPFRSDIAIAIYSTNAAIAECLTEQINRFDAIEVTIATDIKNIEGNSIVVAIQDSYDAQNARSLINMCLHDRTILLLHSYFVFRNFVIDGLYSSGMALPDHFSGLHNLANLDRSSKFRPVSWADIFYSDPMAIEVIPIPTLPRSTLETMAALHLLYTHLRPLISNHSPPIFSEDLSTITEMNLDSGILHRVRGVHSTLNTSIRECVIETL